MKPRHLTIWLWAAVAFSLAPLACAQAPADAIVSSIVRKALGEAGNKKSLIGKFGDWSHDPDEWVKARAKLAAAILKARKAAP